MAKEIEDKRSRKLSNARPNFAHAQAVAGGGSAGNVLNGFSSMMMTKSMPKFIPIPMPYLVPIPANQYRQMMGGFY